MSLNNIGGLNSFYFFQVFSFLPSELQLGASFGFLDDKYQRQLTFALLNSVSNEQQHG